MKQKCKHQVNNGWCKARVNNCAVRGYKRGYIPMRYADEIASDCILKVLDKAKKEATQDV